MAGPEVDQSAQTVSKPEEKPVEAPAAETQQPNDTETDAAVETGKPENVETEAKEAVEAPAEVEKKEETSVETEKAPESAATAGEKKKE